MTFVLILSTAILFCVNIVKKNEEAKKQEQNKQIEKEEKNTIEYKANQTIRVKYTKTGEVVAMDINDYLRGVVPSEMSPTYNIEALKAQALVARTYTYKKLETHAEGEEADMCDNFAHCQAFYPKDKLFQIWRQKGYDENTILSFWDKINEAVVSTQNEIITYQGKCIKAFFHASSPEGTENISEIWGGETLPYLLPVESKEEESYANRTSQASFSYEEFLTKLKEDQSSRSSLTVEQAKETKICDETVSGRVKNIQVGDQKISAEKLRTILGLKSTKFTLELTDTNIIFHVIGYGHGVGMSQVGANYYANHGMGYADIITHYYTGVSITKLE